ncbi:MAG TPA: FAD-dependent oxidoreductase [Chloroflexota bacterium]|jgi:phytoene dehydrogenase-like protein
MSPSRRAYDAIVVGAGLGGLLAAATIAKSGGSVLVLERLRYLGGRFTTVDQDGCAITTGALHMAPHGSGGPLARAMRELGLSFDIVPRDVLASFRFRGQHVMWHKPWDVLRLFSPQGRLDMVKITTWMSAPFAAADAQPFGDWLASQTRDVAIHQFFESFVQFAVCVTANQISFGEMRAIHQNVLRYGMPGTPVGGCSGVVDKLAEFIRQRRGDILTGVEVVRILADRRVQGVQLRDRNSRETLAIHAPVVVSDAGPESTQALLGGTSDVVGDVSALPKAAGLKLHIVSDKSLIPHNGIMLCLDTRRISGMVEVSRAVPSAVPHGKHMIDTFQVMRSDNLTDERDLAVADLRDIFGADFDRHCQIVRSSAFRGRWPVNQARQGFDLHNQEPMPGLLMVGDAYKPRGHMMAEGVAAGVRRVAPKLRSMTIH